MCRGQQSAGPLPQHQNRSWAAAQLPQLARHQQGFHGGSTGPEHQGNPLVGHNGCLHCHHGYPMGHSTGPILMEHLVPKSGRGIQRGKFSPWGCPVVGVEEYYLQRHGGV